MSVSLQDSLTPIAANFQNSLRWGCTLLVIDSSSFEHASNCEKMLVDFVNIISFLLIKSLSFVLPVRIHPIFDPRRCSVSVISVCCMDTM